MAQKAEKSYYIAAKTSNTNENEWLPLLYHMQDTEGVMRYLIDRWLPLGVFKEIAIEKDECKKIGGFLALVHDIGKATPVFQNRIFGKNEGLREFISCKLEVDIPRQFYDEGKTLHAHAGATLLRSMECPKDITYIVGAHHGKPESDVDDFEDDLNDLYPTNYGTKQQTWKEIQKDILDFALEKSGYECIENLPEKIPQSPQMILTGLLIMADWIASNQSYFPLISINDEASEYDSSRVKHAIEKLELPEPCCILEDWRGGHLYCDRFGFEPNEVQSSIYDIARYMEKPGLVILEAPMGCGKTEAALAMAEIMMNKFDLGGIGFFLPSQATSNAMFSRIESFLKAQPDIEEASIQLAHAHADLNEDFVMIKEGYAQIEVDAFDKSLIAHSFFGGRKTKLLASIVVGTVDQLLMAALKQKHVMLRHLGLVGKVIIIDECHAYDAYMNVYLDRVLQWLSAYDIPVILLSATLPGHRRKQLLEAYAGRKACVDEGIASNVKYPLISYTDGDEIKQIDVSLQTGSREVHVERNTTEQSIECIKNVVSVGGCVGIILNTVRRVQEFYDIIRQQCSEASIYVDHSQFLVPDRVRREDDILEHIGKNSTPETRQKVIVIGSQVLEQSLDIDFDILITDLCPMDLLMQRIGRLHRHPRVRADNLGEARCIVLGADEDELEKGSQYIYGDYLLKKTIKCLPDKVRIPDDISKLVHIVYDGKNEVDDIKTDCEKHETKERTSESHADVFCLSPPCNDKYSSDIVGLLDGNASFTEPQARAAVRDGVSSIEVILLKEVEIGKAQVLSELDTIDMSREPSIDEARMIARQRVRLPSVFSQRWNIRSVVESLELQTKKIVPEWPHSSWLIGELIVLLDVNDEFVLEYLVNEKTYRYTLHYDKEKGLSYKEDKDD